MGNGERFTQWLSEAMASRNWSQGELARRSGLSQSMVSLLVLGRNAPGVDTLQCLARAFNMRREDVFRIAGYLEPLPDQDDPALAELQYLVKRLPTLARKRVLDYVRYVDGRAPRVTVAESAPEYDIDPCDLFHRLSPHARKPVLDLLKLLADDAP